MGIMYSFGIVFTQAAKEDDSASIQLDDYFGSVVRSIVTLFKCVTNGMSWDSVFESLLDVHWFYATVFLMYIIFATFSVLNVMIGQFCQVAIESAKEDDEEAITDQLANKHFYVAKLKLLFASLAEDIEDGLTLDIFEKNMHDARVEAYFHSLDIKIWDAWTLFRLLDEHGNRVIDMNQFIEGCLQLKGPATAIGLKKISSEIKWLENKIMKLDDEQKNIMKCLQDFKHDIHLSTITLKSLKCVDKTCDVQTHIC